MKMVILSNGVCIFDDIISLFVELVLDYSFIIEFFVSDIIDYYILS